MTYILLIVGFILLVKGADWFVSGSSAIAAYFRIPPFLIGLTIVACGTGLPEAAISVTAAIQGANGIVIGNVVGSNLFNLLVALGTAAAIRPCPVEIHTVRFEYPLSLALAILVPVFCLAGGLSVSGANAAAGAAGYVISRGEGAVLLTIFVLFLTVAVCRGRYRNSQNGQSEQSTQNAGNAPLKSTAVILAGAAGVILGGDLVVESATVIAQALGIDETIIGLTVVALGTSLPELVTGAVAAYKGKTDIAAGNVIGSNIFNISVVLGLSAVIHPVEAAAEIIWDMLILTAAGILVYVPIAKRRRVGRGWGLFLILLYGVYLAFIVMRAV